MSSRGYRELAFHQVNGRRWAYFFDVDDDPNDCPDVSPQWGGPVEIISVYQDPEETGPYFIRVQLNGGDASVAVQEGKTLRVWVPRD